MRDASALLEDNLLKVPVQEENIWPHLEDIMDEQAAKMRQRLANKCGGGGSWPETAANQP